MPVKKIAINIRDSLNLPIFQKLNNVEHVVNFQRFFGCSPKANQHFTMTSSYSNDKKNTKNNLKTSQTTTLLTQHESVIESTSWYYYFRTMSSLANETFTTLLFCYLFWNFDNTIARQLTTGWFFVIFLGQLLKDILKIPRPASPPVIVFESNYANEYGMPSTHAMVGACIPIIISFLLNKRFQIPIMPMFPISLIWCIPVCLSRLYLGMHTILEILVGLLLTFILLGIILPILGHLDLFIITCPYWVPISIAITTFLAYMYPNPLLYSPTRGDSCTTLGAFSGLTIGSWFNYRYLGSKIMLGTIYSSMYGQSFSFDFATVSELAYISMIQFARCSIGIFVVLFGREILSKSIYRTLCWLNSLDPKDKLTKYDKKVEIPLKLIVYTYVGAAISCFSPFVMSIFDV